MDAIKERIIKQIVGTLGQIAIANGYANDIASIQRYQLSGLVEEAVPVLYVREGEDLVMREKNTRPYVHRQVEVYVSIIHRPGQSDTRAGEEVLTSIGADVERCVMADPTRNGLAIWTHNPDWWEAALENGLPSLGKALRFTIDYRHHFQNPAEQ